MASEQPKKHLFTKHLHFQIGVNCFPLALNSQTHSPFSLVQDDIHASFLYVFEISCLWIPHIGHYILVFPLLILVC